MTDETYGDTDRFTLFDVHYIATTDEANAAWLRFVDTPEWLTFEHLRNMAECVTLQHDEIASDLCLRFAKARREATKAAARILAEMGLSEAR